MIVHGLKDGLFPAKTVEELRAQVVAFLEAHHVRAEVSSSCETVTVVYPDVKDIDADEDQRIVVGFCEAGRFGKAKKVVRELIEKRPWDANAYRLKAQILMEEKDVEGALVRCHEALCLSPQDQYALVLMGNLLLRGRNDLTGAQRYYKRAAGLYPDAPLVLMNYANLLMQQEGSAEEIERLLKRAIELDPRLLTAYYALTHHYIRKQDAWAAFNAAQDGLRLGLERPENREPLKQMLLETISKLAPTLCPKDISSDVMAKMREYGDLYGVPMRLEENDALDVPMRLELAENHHRDEHVIVYNPKTAGDVLNPLLYLTLEKHALHMAAKRAGKSKRIASGEKEFAAFRDWTRNYMTDKVRSFSGGDVDGTLRYLHQGLVVQLMNCVLDALAERRLFENYPKLRPAQYLNDFKLAAGIVESARIGEKGLIPKNVVRATRTMGCFTLMTYADIIGLDLVMDQRAPVEERKVAVSFFKAFKDMEKSYTPGDEWNLVAMMAKELHLGNCCLIVSDDDAADIYAEVAKAKSKLAARDEAGGDASNDSFLKDLREQPAIGMSVMFYMMDAIKQLRKMTNAEVQKIAIQIATMGITGIQPGQKCGYKISALPDKDMSGCQALAWYYASWRIAFPDKIGELEKSMPFAEEYQMAVKMLEAKGGNA